MPWQHDPASYDLRHRLAPQYSHLDTIRHVNNVAVHGMHLEARVRYQLSIFGDDSLFSDAVLLRPRRTVTHFLRETHYPYDITCAARLVAVEPGGFRLATGLFQQGECVGVQNCLTSAWHGDRWSPLPDASCAALEQRLAAQTAAVNRWPQSPPEHLQITEYPVTADISGRYADLDPDGVLGELTMSRFVEQSRAGSLRPIRRDPALGMLVASVDMRYHRWHRGSADARLACGIERIGNSSFALAGVVAVNSQRLITARSTMVLIDQVRRRPTPIGEPLRAAMAPLFVEAEPVNDGRRAVSGRSGCGA